MHTRVAWHHMRNQLRAEGCLVLQIGTESHAGYICHPCISASTMQQSGALHVHCAASVDATILRSRVQLRAPHVH